VPQQLLRSTFLAFALLSATAFAHGTVTISGVVYTFNTPFPVAGATVSIAEYPQISTTSDAAGHYTLSVPDDALVTPVASLPGYRTEYLQTFETDGDNIANAHFQFIPEFIYQYLAAALGLDPNSPLCNIASTVSVAALHTASWEELMAFGPQGETGATVTSHPALLGPIYFNEQTLPDPTLTSTTNDGGVLYVNVPPGVYRISAHHPDHRFAKMTVTCEPGRFINPSPSWGLWEKR
jgi:hypothetical protein